MINISQDTLENLYVKEKLSAKQIAKTFKVAEGTILNRLKKYNIPIRSSGDYLEDLTGKEFGMLKVIKFTGKYNKNQTRIWLCRCECGNDKEVHTGKLIEGTTRSCGNRNCKRKNSVYFGYEEIYKSHWSQILKSAKIRNIDFKTDIKYVWDLFLKQNRKCALSNLDIGFANKVDIDMKTASLDRIDSESDYNPENIQWVHKIINKMKGSMNEQKFIKLCGLIWENSKHKLKDNS